MNGHPTAAGLWASKVSGFPVSSLEKAHQIWIVFHLKRRKSIGIPNRNRNG